jgi:type II secretion system protein C
VARDSLARAALAAVLSLAALRAAQAVESRSGARLLGTIVSSDVRSSQAVISEAGKQRVVTIGMDVDGAEVVEIQAEAVLLRRQGRIETLTLAMASTPSGPGGGNVPAAAAPGADDGGDTPSGADRARGAAPVARRPPARGAFGASASRGTRGSSGSKDPSSEKDAARSNDQILADLANQARFAPVMDNNGKLRGVAIMNVMPDSMIERLGLRSDDVVVAIQGTPIDSSGAAMNVARGLDYSSPVTLGIERRGVPAVVVVQPASLRRP